MKRFGRGKSIVWEDADIAYLRDHFANDTAGDIADHLGVSYPVVVRKAGELGLRKSECFSKNAFHGRYVRNYSGNR